jgi:hypothetical protein
MAKHLTTVEILVGADNATGLVDREALAAILDARHQGWTIRDGVGSWNGKREESVSILLADRPKRIRRTIVALRDGLNQEAVAWHPVAPLRFV